MAYRKISGPKQAKEIIDRMTDDEWEPRSVGRWRVDNVAALEDRES